MALIELNLEKPALKRVESGEKQQSQSDSGLLQGSSSSKSEKPKESKKSESSKQSQSKSQQSDSGGKSRIRKYGRRMAILGGTAAGVAAARKLRKRQKSGSGQQNLEEDWQTAETSSSSRSSGSQSSGSQSSGSQSSESSGSQ